MPESAIPFFLPSVKDFLLHLQVEAGLAKNTLQSYNRDLRDFSAYLLECGRIETTSITRDDLRGFVGFLCAKHLAPSSRARILCAVRQFFKFLLTEKIITANPCEYLDSPKLDRQLPVELSPNEISKVIAQQAKKAQSGNNLLAIRNHALVEMFYACGARVSEIADLRLRGIDLKNRTTRLIGKGSKERIAPFGEPAAAALEKYLAQVRPQLDPFHQSPLVFLSRRGKRLARENLHSIIRDTARQAGINRRVYPHLLRHSFATHLLAGGAHLRAVQEMLGHTDIATTEIYTHIHDREKFDIFHACHPRS